MEIQQIIGYRNTPPEGNLFSGKDIYRRENMSFPDATPEEIETAVSMAGEAFDHYRKARSAQRADFLEAIADGIEGLGEGLLDLVNQETSLPLPRLAGERSRTTGQLRMFARLLREGKWNPEIVDEAKPDRKPVPGPRLVQKLFPLGPVAVFGASNFPLAFSVAGGDTASALAAGCPVVFKAHPAHPATCQLIGSVIAASAKQCNLPEGVFALLHGRSQETGANLVTHPKIQAVAFTGSFKGGKALYDLAVRRPEPIPVYAEMGSVNPVFFLPAAISEPGEGLAEKLAQSVTLGSGQFCTNPGVCVFIESPESRRFTEKLAPALSACSLHPMLTAQIAEAYFHGSEKQAALKGAELLLATKEKEIHPHLVRVSAKDALAEPRYFEEVFGPSTLAVMAASFEEMLRIAVEMPGQLTATVHATEKDFPEARVLIDRLILKAGRLILNEFPTGVEVSPAMVHGGPFPSTTDSRSTSVGTGSIYRFLRPVCFQNMPSSLFPGE